MTIKNEGLMILLSQVVDGLVSQGYRVQGGSNKWRMLESDTQGVKVYFNSYENPTHIVTKVSWKKP